MSSENPNETTAAEYVAIVLTMVVVLGLIILIFYSSKKQFRRRYGLSQSNLNVPIDLDVEMGQKKASSYNELITPPQAHLDPRNHAKKSFMEKVADREVQSTMSHSMSSHSELPIPPKVKAFLGDRNIR